MDAIKYLHFVHELMVRLRCVMRLALVKPLSKQVPCNYNSELKWLLTKCFSLSPVTCTSFFQHMMSVSTWSIWSLTPHFHWHTSFGIFHVFSSARSLTCCAWSGSPQPNRLTPSARCACKGCVFPARSWIPPCRVCGHSCASPGTPRRWSLCLEGLLSAPFVGLCSARFPAIVHCGPPSAHALTCGLLD